jgi:CheY-like chemotaxis protein
MINRAIVLVVEDEPLLRMAGADMVEDAGFGVIEAANATEAVRTLEARPDISLVFLDIDMPGGLDGMKLAAIISNRWPPIEHPGIRSWASRRSAAPNNFFPKPYREDEIVEAMQRLAA